MSLNLYFVMRKILLYIVCACTLTQLYAQEAMSEKNQLSLFSACNFGAYILHDRPQKFTTKDVHNNLGFGYYRKLGWHIGTWEVVCGVRVIRTQSELTVHPQVQGISELSGYTFRINHTQFAVPLLVQRSFRLSNFPTSPFRFQAGLSLGVSRIMSIEKGFMLLQSDTTSGPVGVTDPDFSDINTGLVFSGTLDAGLQVAPFHTNKLWVGAAVNLNLFPANTYKYRVGFGNLAASQIQYIDINFARRYTSVLFSVNYNF